MKLNIQLFGGSVVIQTITETTDIDTNQSTFTIPAKMTTTGETHNYSNASMTMQWRYEGAESWTSLNKQTFSINKSSSVPKSWTLVLTHNDDGSLSNVQFRVSWYITDSTKGTTGATTFTPTTIPRASQPSLVTWPQTTYDITMGNQIYVHMNRVSPSFTHSVYYNFGSLTNQLIATNVTDNCTWTPPLTLANQIPSSTSGVGSVLVKTYNGSTYVGEKSVSFRASVPSSVVPSASFTRVVEAGDVPSSWEIYVKNKSRIGLTISGSGIYGSSISSYKISYYGGSISTNSGTTSYLTQTGSTTFTGQVSDTRGRSATTTSSPINVVDYSNPTISTAQVQRCDANGNIDNNGEYMYISYGASISSCSNKNTPSAVYKVGYRVHNTGSYQYVPLTTNANSYSANGMLFSDGIKAAGSSGTKVQFSTSNTYDIIFYVKDYFMEYTNLQLLDAGFDLMNFNASGKSMAIGKVSEATSSEEKLEIGIPTYVEGETLFVNDGDISVTANGIYNVLNNSYGFAHYSTNAGSGHWFNTDVKVQGNVYAGSGYDRQLAFKDEIEKYSTSETAIGTWIDNKTLYRKVISFTTALTSGTNTKAHGISNPSIIFIEKAFMFNTTTGSCYPLNITLYESSTGTDNLSVKVDKTNICFFVATSWDTHWQKVVVLNYTK